MGKVEDFDNLDENTSKELGTLAYQLLNDPKTRKKALRLVKEIKPETAVPEVELEDAFSEREKKLDDKIAALEKREKETETREMIDKGRKALKEKGISDEEIKEIEKRMEGRELPLNYEKAGDYFKMERNLAKPTPSYIESHTVSVPQIDLKNTNLENWARKTAEETLRDVRSGKLKEF